MCVTDRHDMTLAVKVALNPNTTNQPTNQTNLFDSVFARSIFSARNDDSHFDRIHYSFTAVHCFKDGNSESSRRHGKNIMRSGGKRNLKKACKGALAAAISEMVA